MSHVNITHLTYLMLPHYLVRLSAMIPNRSRPFQARGHYFLVIWT